ncbi:GIY-YIG nuclease family protein [Nocardioides mesophilus]|uniref:GIY-YIG nuclease family protein n=1 Tax=Nocardioides mesophilus TaxID=433659 RepID=UPI003CCD6C6E
MQNCSDDDQMSSGERWNATEQLLHPAETMARHEVLSRPSPVPATAGVYAWYFDEAPPGVPLDDCHATESGRLLYVGISPKAPSRDGLRQSRQNLRTRIRYHYRGNAAGSTLRLTLGSLLADQLGISLRRVGSGQRLTFSDGEFLLSEWMAVHARVCWAASPTPWLLETHLIEQLSLPLNLDQNKHSGFHEQLSKARTHQRARARALPVLPR